MERNQNDSPAFLNSKVCPRWLAHSKFDEEIIGPKYINEPTSCSLFNLKLHNCNYVNEDI